MRQFDLSLQKLGKMLYTFFQEEQIESQDEKEALLKMASDKMIGEYMLERSIQAGRDGIERLKNQNATN